MSSKDFDKLINNFNKMVNNEVAYQFIEDISDASNSLWDYLVNKTKLSFEERNFIIGFICFDYLNNPFIKDKIDLVQAIERFNIDNIFGVNVLDEYIEKHFYDAILINRYNNLNLNYSEELELDDDQVTDRIYEVLNNSSFFNNEEKEKIIKYLIEECQESVESSKENYKFSEMDYNDNYLSDLEYYYENIDEIDLSDDEFILNLINHYFSLFIESDFKLNRLEYMISSIMEKENKLPKLEEIEKMYDDIVIKDEKYGYMAAIEYILEFVSNNDFENYDTFINDREFGIRSLIKIYQLSLGDNSFADLDEEIFFVNELARDILYNLVGDLNHNDSNVAEIEYYFNLGFGIKEFYEPYKRLYSIDYNDMVKIQKICLISDYYNKYSDNMSNDAVSNNIKIINENSQNKLLELFDENLEFKKSLIESFVDDIFTDSYGVSLCSDINTLKRVNPFTIIEMSSNKAYQKKLG